MSKDWSGKNNPGFKHGLCGTPEHRSWKHMLRRCYDTKDIRFPIYGGRGVTVCDEWRNDFRKFLQDVGPKPKLYTLHRINNELGYCPSNCAWADMQTQQRNRRNNRIITAFGTTGTLAQWAEEQQISIGTIWARLNRGWSQSRSVSVPVRRFA
jgi:hypothetical protein